MDQMPDYAKYTLDQLYDVHGHVDREKHPDRFQAVVGEIERRKSDPVLIEREEKAKADQREKEKYDTFWNRFWAGIIDGLLFLPLSYIDKFLFTAVSSHLILGIWSAFSSSAFIIYSVSMLTWRGQTIGKKLCHVKVCDISGGEMGLKQAVLRDLPAIINTLIYTSYSITNIDLFRQVHMGNPVPNLLPSWFWIISLFGFIWFLSEFLTMLTNSKRRALHDYIAGTVVIKNI